MNRNLYKLYRIACADLLVLQDMEYNGIQYDKENGLKYANELQTKIDAITREFRALVNDDFVSISSGKHVSAVLYGGNIIEDVRVPVGYYKSGAKVGQVRYSIQKVGHSFPQLVVPPAKSETVNSRKRDNEDKEYSVSEDTLSQLKHKKGVAKLISCVLEYRRLEKLRGTYLQGWADLLDEQGWKDNVIHGNLNQAVAVTGRLTSTSPNLQNVDPETKRYLTTRKGLIVNVDVKGLEVVTAGFLSQDKVLYKELNEGLDIHADNQAKFGLPSRLVAKVFKFRLLYGGQYFSLDPDFIPVSSNQKYWDKVIEKYYEKYTGIGAWHRKIVAEVIRTGKLTSPSGRMYTWELQGANIKKIEREVKNYPVQGFGADIVMCARVSLFKRWLEAGIKGMLINTVHDSIVMDIEEQELGRVVELVRGVFKDLPGQLSRIFNINFDLDVKVEILFGKNQFDMEEYK